jgi:predicted DCC family thiol-disulfide oxidoreductase YuxK
METLTVLYDPGCSLCQWATRWLISKPKLVDMNFVPAASDLARSMYPYLDHEATLGDVTVIDNAGNVYTNEKAWVVCLWCLVDYRASAERLSTPRMLPMTKRFVRLVSKYRPTTTENCEGACRT